MEWTLTNNKTGKNKKIFQQQNYEYLVQLPVTFDLDIYMGLSIWFFIYIAPHVERHMFKYYIKVFLYEIFKNGCSVSNNRKKLTFFYFIWNLNVYYKPYG